MGRTESQNLIPKMVRSSAARVRVSRKSLSRSQGFSRFASHTVAMTNHHENSIGKPLKSRRARGRFCSALAVVLALAVSGVGLVVGESAASASSKTTTKTSTTKSLKKFDSCLKKHGVKIPSTGAGGPPKGGAPSGTIPSGGGAPGGFKGGGKFQKALKACSKFQPTGSPFGGGSGTATTASTAFAAFRNCMTLDHVTLAKGAYGNTSSSSSAVTSTSSSTYKKAYSACSVLLPKTTPKSG